MKNISHKIIFFISGLGVTLILFSFITQKNNALQESIKRGESIYAINCASCHMQDGNGVSGVYPPVANADYFMADTKRAIRQIKNGVKGEIKVNDIVYNVAMVGVPLTDIQLADVMNYMRNTWGNKGKMITEKEVKAALQK